jgi:hypothetical protein
LQISCWSLCWWGWNWWSAFRWFRREVKDASLSGCTSLLLRCKWRWRHLRCFLICRGICLQCFLICCGICVWRWSDVIALSAGLSWFLLRWSLLAPMFSTASRDYHDEMNWLCKSACSDRWAWCGGTIKLGNCNLDVFLGICI